MARKRGRRASQMKRARKRVKPAKEQKDEEQQEAEEEQEGAEEEQEEEEEYEVEAIVGKKGKKYCVKWKDYDEVSWESKENLRCDELIRRFEEDEAKKVESRRTLKVALSAVKASVESGAKSSREELDEETKEGDVVEEVNESEILEDAARTRPPRHDVNRVVTYASKSNEELDREDEEDDDNDATFVTTVDERVVDTAQGSVRRKSPLKQKRTVQPRATQPSKPTTGGVERSFMGKLVAYSPKTDKWLNHKSYEVVGSTFIVGRICLFHYAKKQGLYEIRWLDTMFQNRIEKVDLSVVKQGRHNYEQLDGCNATPRWTRLCQPDVGCEINEDCGIDDLVEIEAFDANQNAPVSISEVEQIRNMTFDPDAQMRSPSSLFTNEDGGSKTRIKEEFADLFTDTASACFFAYLPFYFWKQVLEHTNAQAKAMKLGMTHPFMIEELMTFLGLLWYMSLVDKGEYANHWGEQVESVIFSTRAFSFEGVMSLRRFKLLRTAFCFRRSSEITDDDSKRDAAVRIRPLLNVLKLTSSRYVDVGRNLAVDEASVAARSKYARHMIVYNPRKPTGKYHFKLYMCCCASSWIALNFRLACESTLEDRLEGIVDESDIQELGDEIKSSARTRQIVLEVVRPFYNTSRIVNCDNYYTSVQLLEALRLKGLYCRGTVKRLSKHFPRHVILGDPSKADKNANKSKNKRSINSREVAAEEVTEVAAPVARIDGEVKRGDYLQAVSKQHNIVAASWCDGNIVTIISNADGSTRSTVKRLIKGERIDVPAPTCIKEYNQNMQGVDRNDQIRARFSIADGHSFKKWYKKLGLAIVDLARVNAFLTRRLVLEEKGDERDSHRQFIIELISEMISGRWRSATSDESMLFGEGDRIGEMASPRASLGVPTTPTRASPSRVFSPASRQFECSGIESSQMFGQSRRKRMCIICRLEGRKDTMTTEYCVEHKVSMCNRVYPDASNAHGCQRTEWTCWEKYHRYYLDKDVFTDMGCVRRSSAIYKEKKMWERLAGLRGNRAASDRSLSYTENDDIVVTPAPSSADTATPAPSFTGTNTPTPSFDFSS